MTIREYAEDVNKSIEDIVKHMERLAMDASDLDRILSDDEIILLDNSIQDDEDYVEDSNEELENDFSLDEKAEEIAYDNKFANAKEESLSKSKVKNNKQAVKKNEFKEERKNIYKHKEKLQSNEQELDDDVLVYKNNMTVNDLADALGVPSSQIIMKLMGLGIMATANNTLSFDNVELLAIDYNKTVKKEEETDISNFENYEIKDKEEDLVERPPVVTIMGHVDHGKTTLLDYIRHSKVVDTEFGGITQHIGAYQIEHNGQKITFIDTPGHAAFTEMRARGASVTDIVIIIVAADDGVMPQTKEAIDHAKSANVPIIVAINKIDKPNINIERVMQEMSENGIMPEEWGGDVPFVKISAQTGEGVDLLLETIQTISEVNGYKANPNRYAMGTVIESKLDKNIGGVASLLIQNGTLRLGDPIVVGTFFGRVRTMKNDLGISIVEAGPSTPVEITGLSDNPSAGDKFMAFETESEAKHVAAKRADAAKQNKNKKEVVSLDDLFAKIKSGQKEINVILKADVRGSEEAVKHALEKIDVEGVKVNVIRSGIGTITESDVVLANASNALVIGFNVMPSAITKEVAKEYSVDIRLYTIIYKVIEEMELAMKGMLDPEFEEKVLGNAEIRKIFTFSKIGKIAGCYVLDGIVKSGTNARVIRDGVIIYDGHIASIQREKDVVKEVKKGFECGITLENFSDIKEGDIIEDYEMVEIKR